MRRRIRHHLFSFHYAWEGLVHTWKNEPNFHIHIIFATIAVVFGLLLKISRLEMILILVMITLGLSAELANTVIEELIDFITTEHRREAKIIKDVAAAMVLIIAAGSLIVAFLIYLPYLINFFDNIYGNF